MLLSRMFSFHKRQSRYLLHPLPDIREDVMDPSLNTDTANGGESLALHHAVGHNAATLVSPV